MVRVSVEWDDTPAVDAARRALVRKGLRGEKAAEVDAAVKDESEAAAPAGGRRETRARLRDDAIRRAVRDFGANVAALVLAPPMRRPRPSSASTRRIERVVRSPRCQPRAPSSPPPWCTRGGRMRTRPAAGRLAGGSGSFARGTARARWRSGTAWGRARLSEW